MEVKTLARGLKSNNYNNIEIMNSINSTLSVANTMGYENLDLTVTETDLTAFFVYINN
jgi:hypothetical protein